MTTDMKTKSEILEKIRTLKNSRFGSVAIGCSLNGEKYELLLLTADCAADRKMMELLGRWRKENEMSYTSQFAITLERTTGWFIKRVTETPDRLLFIISTPKGYIGHVGLFRLDFDTMECEIDNILRGEKDYPGIIQDAIANMHAWGRRELGIKGYSLQTWAHNERSIRLYERLGYEAVKKEPMIQVMGKDGLEWTEAPAGFKGEAKRFNLVMKLRSDSH